ncbi:MAG: hypothetical protein ACW967_06260 [Candidatus Hodarchaeales archaeon]|jgi:hypothetical protein
MEVFDEKITGFRLLVGYFTQDGFSYSKHKIVLLVMFVSSFILLFFHFTRLDSAQVDACKLANGLRSECNFSSPYSTLAIIFYIYITFIAIFSLIRKGKVPNYKLRRTTKKRFILGTIIFIIFWAFIVGLIFYSGIIIVIGTLYLGFIMYGVWIFLEPFLLLGGILAILAIYSTDYPLSGFKRKTIIFLIINFFIAIIGSSIILRAERIAMDEDFYNFLGIKLYAPAFTALSDSFRALVRFRGKTDRREDKKGAIPWLFLLAMIMASSTIIPVMLSTGGDLPRLTSLTDLFSLFLAMILGVWRVLGVDRRETPLTGWERINPADLLGRIHPYTKALFLFSLSMIAFFESMTTGAIAEIAKIPDSTKIIKMEILASLFGLAYITILLRYVQIRSDEDGVIKRIKSKIFSRSE